MSAQTQSKEYGVRVPLGGCVSLNPRPNAESTLRISFILYVLVRRVSPWPTVGAKIFRSSTHTHPAGYPVPPYPLDCDGVSTSQTLRDRGAQGALQDLRARGLTPWPTIDPRTPADLLRHVVANSTATIKETHREHLNLAPLDRLSIPSRVRERPRLPVQAPRRARGHPLLDTPEGRPGRPLRHQVQNCRSDCRQGHQARQEGPRTGADQAEEGPTRPQS
jgi:hypothetical protein